MADEPNLNPNGHEPTYGPEEWDWLADDTWTWLTNCQASNINRLLSYEEWYGQDNIEIRSPAYDVDRKPLDTEIVAVMVKKAALIESGRISV